MDRSFRVIFQITFMTWILCWSLGIRQPTQAQNLNYLHTDGNRILDRNNQPVIITGLSWFGLETENYTPHGLWARSLDSFLDQIVQLGFNVIRLPFSNQLLDPASVPNGINYDVNPDLKELNGLEIMDRVIAGAGERGLKVILDRHRPDSHSQSELWYTPQYSEERWINDWVMLAERYSGDDTVIGVDLHNEPHGQATWGSADPATDWRLAAERAGNAILKVNPNLLIIVQGVEKFQGDSYWWGGNLMGAREYPIRLDVENQLVYSPHTYGPGVYPQPWFSDPNFPNNMPDIWDRHWGYLNNEGIAPVIVGEFGGRSVKNDKEGIWQQALVSYLRDNKISYLYWTLNPNSGDTGGILLDDWQSVDPEKEKLLSSYQNPMIGTSRSETEPGAVTPSGVSATPTAVPAAPTSLATETSANAPAVPTPSAALVPSPAAQGVGLLVRYRTSDTADMASDSKPEFIIVNTGKAPVRLEELELAYWFKDDPGQSYAFQCDWAEIGCQNISGEFQVSTDGSNSVRIHFQPGLAPLAPGADSGEIKIRFNRVDWSQISQTDDYSFSIAPDYVDWEKVTLYLGGQLVWGSEPGATLTSPTTATIEPVTATPISSEAAQATPAPTMNGPANSGWEKLAVTALIGFAAGLLIALIWFFRFKR